MRRNRRIGTLLAIVPPKGFGLFLISPPNYCPCMQITWTMPNGQKRTGRIDAHVMPFVEALGAQDACTFLLAFGGSEVYVSGRARRGGMIARAVGLEILEKLEKSSILGVGPTLIPMGNAFIARYLRSQGMGISEIGRKARITTTTVRELLQTDEARRSKSIERSARLYGPER